ncbi:MAG: OstA-like protein [Rhodothermales bacterium]|nr:OstA-like protein [Rhodothermales bacterium]
MGIIGLYRICALAALGLCALLAAPVARAQPLTPADTTEKQVDILQANRLSRAIFGEDPVQVLEGQVHLRQEQTDLWADRVVRYLEQDRVILTGRVMIVERGDSLRADSIVYNTRLKQGQATGRVHLTDGDVQVYAPSALYYADEKRTDFDREVRLIDSRTVLTSRGGQYYSDEKQAEFYRDVVLDEDRTHLEADSITYFRETEVSIGRGNVFVQRIGGGEGVAESDTLSQSFLFGAYAFNDNRSGYSQIEGDALLVQFRRDSTGVDADTLLMRALRLDVIRDDSLQRLIAVDSVRVWQKTFAAVADSSVYDRITREGRPLREENRFYVRPMAWYEQYQLSGDTLRATATAGSIDSLFIRENAFAAQEDTSVARIHQLRGQHLVGIFRADSLRSLTVGPTAESIYYRNDGEGAVDGAMRASGDTIVLRFAANELKRISIVSGTQNVYYAASLIPSPFELEGFAWRPEWRPAKDTLLDADRRARLDAFRASADVGRSLHSPRNVGGSVGMAIK